MRWFRLYTKMLDDPAVQMLPPEIFKQKFFEAMLGAENEFSPFLESDPQDGRPTPTEWAALRSEVFERDNYTCQYCDARGGKLECDHKHPVSRGGSNELENLVTACQRCNRAKHAKIVSFEQWRAMRRGAA